MSEVSLQIGGRTYRVACATGEEDRITRLGATIADKLASMGNPSGPDAQNLLFAALLLADEVQEGRDGVSARITALEGEQARLQGALQDAANAIGEREADAASLERQIAELRSAPGPAAEGTAMDNLAPALERFAEMLEECADKLESRAPTP